MKNYSYSIKDIETLSGIKAHTLRIWEQRYDILKPYRTDTNIRFYSNEDLRRILNISLLNRNGKKISAIALLNDQELIDEVNKLTQPNNNNNQIENLILSMIELDEERFEKVINSAILRVGLIKTIEDVLYPFLQKIGIMWLTGAINPAQEHFISNLIRQKIIVAIDGQLVKQNSTTKKVILFLPEGELHEISLLVYAYIVRNKGHQSIYLGQSVPLTDIVKVVNIRQAEYIVTIITQPIKDNSLVEYLKAISKTFPEQQVFISGAQVSNQALPSLKNVLYFNSPNDFMEIINKF